MTKTRRERSRGIAWLWAPDRPPVGDERPQGGHRRERRGAAALQAPRRTDSEQRAHEQPEIAATGVDQQPLQDVVVPSEMRAATACGAPMMMRSPIQIVPASSTFSRCTIPRYMTFFAGG